MDPMALIVAMSIPSAFTGFCFWMLPKITDAFEIINSMFINILLFDKLIDFMYALLYKKVLISYAGIAFVWYYLVAVIFAAFLVAIICCKGWDY